MQPGVERKLRVQNGGPHVELLQEQLQTVARLRGVHEKQSFTLCMNRRIFFLFFVREGGREGRGVAKKKVRKKKKCIKR